MFCVFATFTENENLRVHTCVRGEVIREATNQAVETEICFCSFESPPQGSQQGGVAQLSTEKKEEKEDVSL